MKKITIAVSGINSVDNPGSGIGIIRSLKEVNPDYRCIGLSYDAMDPGLYLDQYVDRGFLLPYPSGPSERYMERLLYICEEQDVDIVIPAFDSELPNYIKNRELLEDTTAYQMQIQNGLSSRRTAAGRLGLDYDSEQEHIRVEEDEEIERAKKMEGQPGRTNEPNLDDGE